MFCCFDPSETDVPKQLECPLHTAFVTIPLKQSKSTSITSNKSHEDTSQMVEEFNIDYQESWYRTMGNYNQFLLGKEEMMRHKIKDETLESRIAFMPQELKLDTIGSGDQYALIYMPTKHPVTTKGIYVGPSPHVIDWPSPML
jgi:hypothetical protein